MSSHLLADINNKFDPIYRPLDIATHIDRPYLGE